MTAVANPILPDEAGLVHAALLYRDPEQLRRAVRTFVGDGVDAGEPVLAVLPAPQLEALSDLLDGPELTHPQLIDQAGPRASAVYGDPAQLAGGGRWPQAHAPDDAVALDFEGDLAALRRDLAAQVWLAGLARERREDYVFAINEVATNAVRHGDGVACARIWRDGDRIVTEVTTATSVADPLAGRRRPAVDALDGRGLWLVSQLCDLVELRNRADGCSVRMHVIG